MAAPPTVVLFDLGGVLLPFDRERRTAAMVEALGITAEAARALMACGIAERMDRGDADETHLADLMALAAGRSVAAEEARRLLLSVFEPPPPALWALAAALRRRTTVGALSDNPRCVLEVFPREDAFDHVFLSCELGLAKPAAGVFREVARRLGCAPAEILFVDDNPANVAAARAAGWDAVVFTGEAQLVAELAARGLS